MIKNLMPYIILALAIGFRTASNSFANSAQDFTKTVPSLPSTITMCMVCLSQVMKSLPVGIAYASFAGICIIGTTVVGIVKFNQTNNIPTIIGLCFVIFSVLTVNLLSQPSSNNKKVKVEIVG